MFSRYVVSHLKVGIRNPMMGNTNIWIDGPIIIYYGKCGNQQISRSFNGSAKLYGSARMNAYLNRNGHGYLYRILHLV